VYEISIPSNCFLGIRITTGGLGMNNVSVVNIAGQRCNVICIIFSGLSFYTSEVSVENETPSSISKSFWGRLIRPSFASKPMCRHFGLECDQFAIFLELSNCMSNLMNRPMVIGNINERKPEKKDEKKNENMFHIAPC